ncbi:universal stress protein [Salinarimonas ramus]|uniref:Universal stress protein UspA n=1 Tax=Salinarimonas ramus TaxID=690164 RepID=A0A917V736_9HYPH|nr:universal stress protein [Salinarimonas ramus]GGK45472.1 universal stress protein UspA [Salinarimonas ramus]
MIKDILVVPTNAGDALGPFAAALAQDHGAAVRIAAPAFDMISPTYVVPEMPVEILDNAREAARAEARARAEGVASRLREAGIDPRTEVISGSFDACSHELQRRARYCDLVVVEQASAREREGEAALAEALLFGAGRPILHVPYVQKTPLSYDHALVAWDESQTAARALGAALPFLARTRSVEVVSIEDGRRPGTADPEAYARHLAAHGVRARGRRIASVGDIADTLLSHAADMGADYLAMGGYGHSRLREFVLGGATRGILRAMTVPVVMMH